MKEALQAAAHHLLPLQAEQHLRLLVGKQHHILPEYDNRIRAQLHQIPVPLLAFLQQEIRPDPLGDVVDHGVDAVYPQHGNHAGMYFHEHGGAVHSPVPVHQDLVGFLALLHSVHEGLVRRDIGHPGHAVLVCGLQGLNAHGPQLGQAVPVEVQSGFVGVHDSSVCRVYQ
ncbi:hypothetical protein D3C75_915290 [compost metagenome]